MNKNSTDGDETRENPFSPPPENKSATIAKMIVVTALLLFALFRIVNWVLDERAQGKAASSSTSPNTGAGSTTPALPNNRSLPEKTKPPDLNPEPPGRTRIITKCVVAGKTSYTDGPCATDAISSQLITKPDQNLMDSVKPAPAKAAVATAQPETSPQPDQTQDRATSSNAAECSDLENWIIHLDNIARQPQGPQTQDWIRNERKKARDRKFRIACR